MKKFILNLFGLKTKEQKLAEWKSAEARRIKCERAFGIKGD